MVARTVPVNDHDSISNAMLNRILDAFGIGGAVAPTFEGLQAVYASWCRHVPFDNVRKRMFLATGTTGTLPGDGAGEFFEHWLADGTGGTCWAGNNALYSLLHAVGFDVRRGVGVMSAARGVRPNHGTVIVRFDDADFLVDASMMHVRPLPLVAGSRSSVDHAAYGVVARWVEDTWVVRWRPLGMPDGFEFRIDSTDVPREVFSELHERARTKSSFNDETAARAVRDESIVGIAAGRIVELRSDGSVISHVSTHDERLEFLTDVIGISPGIVSRIPLDHPAAEH